MFKNFLQKIRQSYETDHQCFIHSIPIRNAEPGEWIKIVPIGYFPEHHDGAHEVTAEHISEMADNFTNSGTDLLVDYEHHSLWGDTMAAGWITKVEARDDGLYAEYPKFTRNAQRMVDEREYRYFSPVYYLCKKDKAGKEIGAFIDSLAITNRPYLDIEIDHIGNASTQKPNESTEEPTEPTDMKLNKENLEALGLSEDATEEEINKAVANSLKANSQQEAGASGEGAEAGASEPEQSEKPKANSENESELEAKVNSLEKKLAEREQAEETQKAEALVNSAIEKGKILPAHKTAWLNSAKADYNATKESLDEMSENSVMPGKVTVNSKQTEAGGQGNQDDAFSNYVNHMRPIVKANRKSA